MKYYDANVFQSTVLVLLSMTYTESSSAQQKQYASSKNVIFTDMCIDKFSVLKYFGIGEETEMYVNSWKERSKISITANFHGEIL